jgi:hypothetical protein
MLVAVTIHKLRAVAEDPTAPILECYDQTSITTMAALAVAKVIAKHTPTAITPKKVETPMTKTPTRPLTSLPGRLDLQACLRVLEQIVPDFKTESFEAARSSVDIPILDCALGYTELSTSDKMNLKAACVRHGILARGPRYGMARI